MTRSDDMGFHTAVSMLGYGRHTVSRLIHLGVFRETGPGTVSRSDVERFLAAERESLARLDAAVPLGR